jgi:hypothetical protein
LSYVGSNDLQALLRANADVETMLHEDFNAILSDSTAIKVSRIGSGGWAATLDSLRSDPSAEADRIDVLLTSASAELADPSRHPREALIDLSRSVRERSKGHVIVLNGSTLSGASERGGNDSSGGGEALDLRIKRLNLAIMEVSNATGLSVLDADRLVAETRLPGKVTGPFVYAPEIQAMLRSALASILGALGFAERAAMEVRLPFIREVAAVSVERWVKSEGDPVEAGEVLCHLRLSGMWRMQRPMSATVLASIDGRSPPLERFLARERVQQRRLDAVVSLVAGERGVLRRVMRPAGAALRSGDVLAILSGDGGVPIGDLPLKGNPFRAVIRTDSPKLEALL